MSQPIRSYWQSANGERTRICDMGDRHLVNTIRMLERQAHQLLQTEEPFPMFQGEMAQLTAEREWFNAHLDDEGEPLDVYDVASELHPRYVDLVEEAERRGLQWEPPQEKGM